jgi:hypothetical protein
MSLVSQVANTNDGFVEMISAFQQGRIDGQDSVILGVCE